MGRAIRSLDLSPVFFFSLRVLHHEVDELAASCAAGARGARVSLQGTGRW